MTDEVDPSSTGTSPSRWVTGKHAAAVPTDAPAAVADVRVVSGEPTAEELAAVVAVLQRQADEIAAAGRAEVTVSPRAGWDASARGMRRVLEHGQGAWARSLR